MVPFIEGGKVIHRVEGCVVQDVEEEEVGKLI